MNTALVAYSAFSVAVLSRHYGFPRPLPRAAGVKRARRYDFLPPPPSRGRAGERGWGEGRYATQQGLICFRPQRPEFGLQAGKLRLDVFVFLVLAGDVGAGQGDAVVDAGRG